MKFIISLIAFVLLNGQDFFKNSFKVQEKDELSFEVKVRLV
jgi:hypothetical protein